MKNKKILKKSVFFLWIKFFQAKNSFFFHRKMFVSKATQSGLSFGLRLGSCVVHTHKPFVGLLSVVPFALCVYCSCACDVCSSISRSLSVARREPLNENSCMYACIDVSVCVSTSSSFSCFKAKSMNCF